MAELTFAAAVRDGLAEEMRRDPLVWALGEDLTTSVGSTSDVQYDGLMEEFGSDRVVNTPISENMIMAAGVGAAVAGTRPVADLRAVDFGLCAMDELVNQAAKIRYMFGGQARVPMVIRQAIGIRPGLAAQHCLSNEAWFVHVPGLVVIAPATPACGKGLLKAAIRSDDPVVLLEHKQLWSSTGDVPDGDDLIVPIGQARIAREGTDLTIVAWSRMALLATSAGERLAAQGIDAEVIDLRSLWPWDKERVYDSVRKTGRLLIPQEAVNVGGFAAEIAMDVMEAVGDALIMPPRRVGAPRVPMPYALELEAICLVTDVHVEEAARKMFDKGEDATRNQLPVT
ncbi:MAG: alpha-ketoacid dehydrogenase subunit beta [Novosphingobium sp.]